MYLRLLWFCIGLIYSNVLVAQINISGRVIGEQEQAIAGANVILKNGINILSFAITGEDGKFEMLIQSASDSLLLEVHHLSYGLKQLEIIKGKNFYTIQVFPQDYILPEVAIEKPPPVRRNGDTLFFDVESYVREGDENIEQVLARIPGIEIRDNGTIIYQGLDISKFYIEGLDLLEGRYRIATRNLGPQHIQEIQILEEHQPIRALDSIHRPENAAINLKLKSNIAITGNGKVEGGIPTVGLLESNIFGFAKKQQFQASASYNNLGENLSSNFINLYQTPFALTQDIIRLDQLRDPFLLDGERLYRNNDEWNGSLSFLRKINEFAEIKFQGSFKADEIIRDGSTLINYFAGEANSSFQKQLVSHVQPLEAKGKVIWQHNGEKIYTKLDTELKIVENQGNANNSINDLGTLESLTINGLELNSILDFLINEKNKKAFQFKAEFQYHDKDYLLDLQDAIIFSPVIAEESFFPELRQSVEREDLLARLYTNFYVKKEHLQGLIELGPKLSRKAIRSFTLNGFEEKDANLIANDFQNNNTTTRLSIFINQSWKFEKDRFKVNLKLPFSYDHFRIKESGLASSNLQNLLIYRPKLGASYQLSEVINVSMGASYFRDFQTYGDLFYEGLIVQANRSVGTQINTPNAYHGFNVSTGLTGLSPVNNNYYGFSLSYSSQTNDQLANTIFNDEGLNFGFNQRKNQIHQLSASGLYKFHLWRTLDLELRVNYNLSEQDQLVNQDFNTIQSHRIGTEQKMAIAYGKQATTINSQYSRFWIPELDQNNDQLQIDLEHFWKINKKWDTKLELRNIYFAGGGDGVWTHLLNWNVQYGLEKQKTRFTLSVYNLLEEDFYTNFSQGLYSNFIARYRLNPRRLVLGIKKQF